MIERHILPLLYLVVTSTFSSWTRCTVKLSGSFLGGSHQQGLCTPRFTHVAQQLQRLVAEGISLIVVVGGGNILRGFASPTPLTPEERILRDRQGMLATCLNGLHLQAACVQVGLRSPFVLSAFALSSWVSTDVVEALRSLEHAPGVVICVGGAGLPYLSTDMVAVMRTLEFGSEGILKATQVDGVYSSDPVHNPAAQRYNRLTHQEVLQRQLSFMDAEAVALAGRHHVPVVVFSCHADSPSLWNILRGSGTVCTLVSSSLSDAEGRCL